MHYKFLIRFQDFTISIAVFSLFCCYTFLNSNRTTITSTREKIITLDDSHQDLVDIATSGESGTATSGRRCKITKSRSFDRQQLLTYTNKELLDFNASLSRFITEKNCRYWATLTTIFNPTDAVLSMPRDWCLVVAADLKGPKEYEITVGPNTVLLTVEDQNELAAHFDLVNKLPWNHFARKNVAYLFAIMNHAEWIWDFDDDNILYEVPNVDSYQNGLVFEPKDKALCAALNPYRLLKNGEKGSADNLWPRGYPLELIHATSCDVHSRCVVKNTTVGIYQSFADRDPDVDAIFRLTQTLPVFFSKEDKESSILIPNGMLSPMNAQAAMVHGGRAGWSLFLPTTVHGRVSDIWRSYIAQTVGRYFGLQTAFLPEPLVWQDRNVHDYLADFNAEIPLYECAGALVKLLREWNPPANSSLPTVIISLYVELFEHNVIDTDDVTLIQKWIESLYTAGYEFPTWDDSTSDLDGERGICSPISANPSNENERESTPPDMTNNKTSSSSTELALTKSYKYDDIALVGQYNYDTDPDQVAHFVRRWNELFRNVSVWGPFSDENYLKIKELGIDASQYKQDMGWYSPYVNLGKSLVRFEADASIKGVLITHDDLIFSPTLLEERGFPDNGHILLQSSYSSETFTPLFYFSNNSMIRLPQEDTFVPYQDWKTLSFDGKRWAWWRRVLPSFAAATSQYQWAHLFANNDGTFSLFPPSPGDFAYVPTRYAKTFLDLALWLADYKVFLEGAMSTIVGFLQDHLSANVTFVETCTHWNTIKRNSSTFVYDCIQSDKRWELYHPIKQFIQGSSGWDAYFDAIVYP